MASSGSLRSPFRSLARRGSSCSTSRRRVSRRPSGATSSPSSTRSPRISDTSSSSTISTSRSVSSYVTMMHNGRIFKEGAPERDRERRRGSGDLSRSGAWIVSIRSAPQKTKAVLQVQDLQVYYGESHALQGVSLTLERGVLSVVGRNGMGKTTLCNAIVGLMPVRSGIDPLRRPRACRRRAASDRPRRRRLRAPGTPPLAEPFGRRDAASQHAR